MYSRGLGDALMFNAVLYKLGKETGRRALLGTNCPSIYRGNPYVALLPLSKSKYKHQLAKLLKAVGVASSINYIDYYRGEKQPKKHILGILSDEVGLSKPPTKSAVFLDAAEVAAANLPQSRKPWIAIQSIGLSDWTDNKNWGPSKMSEVVRLLADEFSFVQLGAPDDPPLEVDLNTCGKLSPRQSIALLASCRGLIAQVGFLMHAASAVGVPSAIVYGGFEAPWQSGYVENTNLYSAIDCSPCWLSSPCPYGKKCLEQISAVDVARAARSLFLAGASVV